MLSTYGSQLKPYLYAVHFGVRLVAVQWEAMAHAAVGAAPATEPKARQHLVVVVLLDHLYKSNIRLKSNYTA